MSFDLGLGFELETMHIVAGVVVILLAVGAFFYFRRKSNHVQFEDSLNQEFPQREHEGGITQNKECNEDKCMIN
jgi:hypothetical protein